jgi:hypothetical protein
MTSAPQPDDVPAKALNDPIRQSQECNGGLSLWAHPSGTRGSASRKRPPWSRGNSLRSRSRPVQTPARVNVTCVTPLGEEVVSTL